MTLTLGFDTAGPYVSAAIFDGRDVPFAVHRDMTKGQAEALLPQLEDLLAEAGVTWNDITRLGGGIGPGNFTGIRIAVAAARGLALGLGIPAVGVSLLEAAALGQTDPTVVVLDARRGPVYVQGYHGPSPVLPCEMTVEDAAALVDGSAVYIGSGVGLLLHGPPVPAVYAPGSAIARIAGHRTVSEGTRPTPLYLRAPDAAPARPVPATAP
mgnify:CR=1 FL=1